MSLNIPPQTVVGWSEDSYIYKLFFQEISVGDSLSNYDIKKWKIII